MNFCFHHTGLIVKNIEKSKIHYGVMFSPNKFSKTYFISSQNVNVCFMEVGENIFVEFVEPVGDNSVIATVIKKKINYYHIGYKVSSVDKAVETLCDQNFKLLETFHSEAFNGNKCAFLYSPELHLIELIEFPAE